MDIQLVLVFILILLTINVLIVGGYVILLLKDLRHTLTKVNSILDDVDSVSSLVSNPMSVLSTIAGTLQEGVKAVQTIKSMKRGDR